MTKQVALRSQFNPPSHNVSKKQDNSWNITQWLPTRACISNLIGRATQFMPTSNTVWTVVKIGGIIVMVPLMAFAFSGASQSNSSIIQSNSSNAISNPKEHECFTWLPCHFNNPSKRKYAQSDLMAEIAIQINQPGLNIQEKIMAAFGGEEVFNRLPVAPDASVYWDNKGYMRMSSTIDSIESPSLMQGEVTHIQEDGIVTKRKFLMMRYKVKAQSLEEMEWQLLKGEVVQLPDIMRTTLFWQRYEGPGSSWRASGTTDFGSQVFLTTEEIMTLAHMVNGLRVCLENGPYKGHEATLDCIL